MRPGRCIIKRQACHFLKKMMKFYKSLLFLFVLNLLILGPAGVLWGFSAGLLLLVPCLTANALMLIAPGFYLKKLFKLSRFPEEDFYGLHKAFKGLKPPGQSLQLFKANKKTGVCIAFWTKEGGALALSEDLLESLSFKDRQQLLRLFFSLTARKGELLFLTLLSGFLLMAEKTSAFFSRWLFLKRRPKAAPGLILAPICKILAGLSRRLFWQIDKNQPQKLKPGQALLLYRLDGLTKARSGRPPLFCAPLFLTDPLTSPFYKGYASFHPQAKERIQGLIGRYPP